MIAFFAMRADGHFRRLLPLIEGVVRRGARAVVYTDPRFAPEVARAGGECVDLFAGRPADGGDPESFPRGVQAVTFAGRHADVITAQVSALKPALVIHDTQAVIGRVVAAKLGIPAVNVCAGHNVTPERFQPLLAADPRVVVSDRCRSAVELLRDRHGIADASPFCYVGGISPHLNVYCEPPEFLDPAERRPFEPVAFFGSVRIADASPAAAAVFTNPTDLKVYVSLGTVAWRSYPAEALAALRVITSALARRPGTESVISLGGAPLAPEVAESLAAPNVHVKPYVDQAAVLARADLFVTHHGLNSTHEAIWHRVPMLSCPFFWDQPGLAAKCQALGIAVPLVGAPRDLPTEAGVLAAVDRVVADRAGFRARLDVARGYEEKVMAGRDAVLDRILALAAAGAPPSRRPA